MLEQRKLDLNGNFVDYRQEFDDFSEYGRDVGFEVIIGDFVGLRKMCQLSAQETPGVVLTLCAASSELSARLSAEYSLSDLLFFNFEFSTCLLYLS